MVAQWQVKLFGGFEVLLNGQPLTSAFETDSARLVFAWLCLNAQKPIRRDLLAALFWPDSTQSASLNSLRVTLTRIRRALGSGREALQTDAQEVRLDLPAGWEVDALIFDQAVREVDTHVHRRLVGCPACTAHLEQAAALYKGDLLAGLSMESAPLQEWLAQQRERHHRSALGVLSALADRAILRRDWSAAYGYAEHQLRLEPWREEAHRQAMMALAEKGDRSSALTQYQRCRDVLRREFDAEPSDETQSLYQALCKGQLFVPQACDQPLCLSDRQAQALDRLPLIGRERELYFVTTMLSAPSVQLLSVIGEGGVGKTRLALRAAQQLRLAFQDGVRFVFLSAEEGSADAASDLIWRIAEACGITLHEGRSIETQLSAALQGRELLLVIDSFEHRLSTAALLGRLLTAAPKCAALITSRQALDLRIEHRVRLDGLPQAQHVSTEPSPSAALFLTCAHQFGEHTAVSALEVIESICTTLHGLPLAIELAAACLTRLSLPELYRVVQHDLDALYATWPDAPERHRSLRAAFESAWCTLPLEGQCALRRLSIIRSACPFEVALGLAGSEAGLNMLLKSSLARQFPDGSVWMHEYVRHFAYERLRQTPEEVLDAKLYYARRHLGWLASSHAHLSHSDSAALREQLVASFDDLDQAWDWAIEHELWELTNAATFAYQLLHRLSGRLVEGTDRFARALSSLPQTDSPVVRQLRARLRVAHMGLHVFRAHDPESEAPLREAAATAEQLGDWLSAATALHRLSDLLRSDGHLDEAHEIATRALALIQRHPTPSSVEHSLAANCWRSIGATHYRAGRVSLAEAYMRTALALAEQAQDAILVARTQELLGSILLDQNRWAESEQALRSALDQYESLRLPYMKATALDLLGHLADARGDYAEAQRNYSEAIALARKSGNRDAELTSLVNLGISCDQMGDYTQAFAHTQVALVLAGEVGDPGIYTTALANLSLHAHHNGQHEQALHYARQATEMAQQRNFPFMESYGWEFQGHALLGLGCVDEAEEAYQHALGIRTQIKTQVLSLESRASLARVALARNELVSALQYVEPIATHLLSGGTLDGAEETLRVYWTVFQVLELTQDTRAEALLHLSHTLLRARAARLSNESSRQAYLSVEIHQAIVKQFAAQTSRPTC